MKTIFSATAAACTALLALAGASHAATVSVTVTDRDGKPVPDAVVVVVPSAPGTARNPLPTQVTINQQKMQFIPAVSVIPVGARVTFLNNDSWEHHTRGSAAGLAQFSSTGGFELRLEGKAEGQPAKWAEVTLGKAGAVLLGCHLHGSMRGHIYVSDSPWAMKTTPEGQAVFEDVPDGAAQVRVWHADQLIDLPLRAVTAGAAPARVNMQLQVVPRRRRI
ncbi:MAG: plastocyanin [Comamonadaceae bacterium]|nr:MAG: plastocyanin [Comamonadaceae bacterium]